jgi:hypothetical protein
VILNVHSDASYLSATNAKSQAAGYYFLGSLPEDGKPIKLNGAIRVLCTFLNFVASSAAEAELGALFLNAKEAKIMWLMVQELGHPQPAMPKHIDNSTTVGIVNNTLNDRSLAAWKCATFGSLTAKHKNFSILADYPRKAHTGAYHRQVRSLFLHTKMSPHVLLHAKMQSE